MTYTHAAVAQLPDRELLDELKKAAATERTVVVRLVTLLVHVDERRLYLAEGFSSLFTYCTQALHLSEHAAYARMEAARLERKFPAVWNLLADGSVTLTSVTLLAPH